MKSISEILGGPRLVVTATGTRTVDAILATHIAQHTMVTKSGTVAVVKEHEDSRMQHVNEHAAMVMKGTKGRFEKATKANRDGSYSLGNGWMTSEADKLQRALGDDFVVKNTNGYSNVHPIHKSDVPHGHETETQHHADAWTKAVKKNTPDGKMEAGNHEHSLTAWDATKDAHVRPNSYTHESAASFHQQAATFHGEQTSEGKKHIAMQKWHENQSKTVKASSRPSPPPFSPPATRPIRRQVESLQIPPSLSLHQSAARLPKERCEAGA